MRKLIFTFCFCLFASFASADHWVYIRLEDRPGRTAEDTKGRSQEGDIVDIVYADYTPSEAEQSEWAIVKVTGLTDEQIEEYTQNWEDKAYRKYKLKNIWVKNLSIGIYPTVINASIINGNIKIKDAGDISKILDYLLNFWVKTADAAVACADDATDGEQICTTNKTGEDYATAQLWEDAKDGDLIAAGQIRTLEVYNEDDNPFISRFVINGSTTSPTAYMKITAPESDRHDGTAGSGSFITSELNFQGHTIEDDYAVIEWLEMRCTGGNGGEDGLLISNSATITIRNNIIHDTTDHGIYFNSNATPGTSYILNNVIYNTGDSGFDTNSFNGGVVLYLYNNTVNNVGRDGIAESGAPTMHVVNNISMISSGNDYDGTFSTDTNNLSTGATVTYENSGAGDFHITSASTDAIDQGTDLGTTAGVNFDIDGRDRDAEGDTWDIGADEFVAGAAAVAGDTWLQNVTLQNVTIQ